MHVSLVFNTKQPFLWAQILLCRFQFTLNSYCFIGGKLASLEEFKVQKEELMGKFAAMEEELKQKDEDHQKTIYDLEKKAVIDKDR